MSIYNLLEENEKRYKGINYYTFNDKYIIVFPDKIEAHRYSLKDVKSCINNWLEENNLKKYDIEYNSRRKIL